LDRAMATIPGSPAGEKSLSGGGRRFLGKLPFFGGKWGPGASRRRAPHGLAGRTIIEKRVASLLERV